MLISHISADHVGKEITLAGWIKHARGSGKIAFIELRDGSGFIQCVAEAKNLGEDKFSRLAGLNIESSLSLTGTVSKHPKKEEYELQVSDFHVYTDTKDYPLGQKEHNPDFLFDMRHLHLRAPSQRAIQRIRDTVIHATYDWMRDHDFTKIDSPIFTPNACEGTTELYEVEHVNGEKMYLSQSGQLYLEPAIASLGRVFDFGPVFVQRRVRREDISMNSEWWMQRLLSFNKKKICRSKKISCTISSKQVLKKNSKELEVLGRDIAPLQKISKGFKRVKYVDRVNELIALGFDVKQGDDIGSDIEMQYCEKIDQPIFVTNFPTSFKAFYFKEDPENPGTVLGADLLAPEGCGEIIWGGTREDDYDKLLHKIKEHGLPVDQFERYLDTRKYGGVPHAGFGYGLERIVRRVCGVHHIRETIPFPRYANRIRP
jgi:asparaginyl-tRNA synthetase